MHTLISCTQDIVPCGASRAVCSQAAPHGHHVIYMYAQYRSDNAPERAPKRKSYQDRCKCEVEALAKNEWLNEVPD